MVLLALLGVTAAVLVSPLGDRIARGYMRMPAIFAWTALFAMLAGLLLPGFAVRLAGQKPLRVEKAAVQKAVFYLVLFLLPPAAAFGTNNTLVFQIWLHITPWAALLFLLFLETQHSPLAWPLGWAALVFTITWLWAGWTQTYFMLPYRLLHDRLSQTETLQVRSPHFRGLKVDAETRAFLETYDAVLANSKTTAGGGVIAVFDMPGLVYLSDGYSPGDIWYQEGEDRNKEIAGYIRESQLPRKSGLILINAHNGELPAEINQVLAGPEIDFPDAYRQLDRIYDPINQRYVSIYERRR
jgi:hypothetical protein